MLIRRLESSVTIMTGLSHTTSQMSMAAGNGLKSNRQPCGSVHVQSRPRFPRIAAGQFDVIEPCEQIRKRDAAFESRQDGAETEMNAMAECDVRISDRG